MPSDRKPDREPTPVPKYAAPRTSRPAPAPSTDMGPELRWNPAPLGPSMVRVPELMWSRVAGCEVPMPMKDVPEEM